MKRVALFCLVACGCMTVLMVIFWGAGLFQAMRLGTSGTIAIVAGILFTTLLATALMALSFYSDSSEIDRSPVIDPSQKE